MLRFNFGKTRGNILPEVSYSFPRYKLKLQDHRPVAMVLHGVPVYLSACTGTKLYCLVAVPLSSILTTVLGVIVPAVRTLAFGRRT